MAQMSDYLETNLINYVFRNTTFTDPGVVYLALYSSDPTDADTGTELIDGTSPAYVRMSLSGLIDAPANGVAKNGTSEILFPAATGDWVGVTHIGIRDDATAGNLLAHQALASTVSVLSGNNFRVPVDQLVLTFS